MTSILNSVAANTALLNLENTIANLNKTQSEISTGLKVQSAADNAAYYSISSVLNSDSSALTTVSDSMNLGNASLSVAANAISQIQTTLNDIKSKLVEATQPNANMATIQQSIAQDQAQLKNISSSANFNGQNFVSVDSSAANYNPTLSFVSSYSRDSTGNISIGYINVDTSGSALFDSGTVSAANSIGTSLTSATSSVATPAGVTLTNGYYNTTAVAAGNNGLQTLTFYTADLKNANNSYVNDVSINSGSAITAVTVVQGTTATGLGGVNLAAGDSIGGIAHGGAGSPSGVTGPTFTAGTTANNGTLSFYVANRDATTAGKVEYDQVTLKGYTPPTTGNGFLDNVNTSSEGSYTANGKTTFSTGGTGVSIMGIDISGLSNSAADLAKLNAFEKQVDAAISNVASAASTLGTAQARIQGQSSFIASLKTSIDNGVGSMVDADMNLASTKLQALQVQQQLGIQSLSIANQSSQMILKLFQ